MRYLITGATGLIGKEIVRLCKTQDIAVNYLTTKSNKIVSDDNYQGFYWNPETGEIDESCFENVSCILNLAGASISKKWSKSYKDQILLSRVNSLKTLYGALNKKGIGEINTLVSASAIGVYPSSLEKYYNELDLASNSSFLGDVVQRWEAEADKFINLNITVAKIRTGLVLTSKGGALPQMAKPINMFVGAAFGTGKQWQSWIHLTDLAGVFLFVAANKLSGNFNGVAPNPVSQNKLLKVLAIVLKRPLWLPNIPSFMIKIILGDMANLLLDSQRVSCKKIAEEGFVFEYQNITATLKAIYAKENH